MTPASMPSRVAYTMAMYGASCCRRRGVIGGGAASGGRSYGIGHGSARVHGITTPALPAAGGTGQGIFSRVPSTDVGLAGRLAGADAGSTTPPGPPGLEIRAAGGLLCRSPHLPRPWPASGRSGLAVR